MVKRLLKEQPTVTFQIDRPASDAENWQIQAYYGLAFLGVRCMGDAYGTGRMLDFFHQVVHDGQAPVVAAPAVYGVDWSKVVTDCNAYVKRAVR
jgi:hypothetical protein